MATKRNPLKLTKRYNIEGKEVDRHDFEQESINKAGAAQKTIDTGQLYRVKPA